MLITRHQKTTEFITLSSSFYIFILVKRCQLRAGEFCALDSPTRLIRYFHYDGACIVDAMPTLIHLVDDAGPKRKAVIITLDAHDDTIRC